MIKKLSWTLLALAAAMLPLAPQARADSVLLTIGSQSIPQGGTVVDFMATIAAPSTNSGTIFLNSDSFTIDSPLSLDDLPFLLNFPFTLNPGQSVTDVLFEVTVPAGIHFGLYSGDFAVLGGANGGALNNISGNVPFSLQVTPEPSTWLLLGSLLGMAALCKKRA